MNAPTNTERLDRDGDTLAHVVEQLVFVAHYVVGEHGPVGAPRPPIERCPVEPCPTWRRYLASRLP